MGKAGVEAGRGWGERREGGKEGSVVSRGGGWRGRDSIGGGCG